jgi:predicted TIM-barrel fold metal-dependent hydrolase
VKKIITIEEHFDTPQAAQLFNKNVGVGQNPKPTYEKLIDFENRLLYMDANGIDMQILSNAGNSPQVLPGNLAISAFKDINDTLSEMLNGIQRGSRALQPYLWTIRKLVLKN